MKRYVGLDVHKRVVEAVILDRHGEILHRERLECTREALLKFAKEQLKKKDRIALEATTNTWAVVDILEPHVKEVVVSNPLRTRAIAMAKVKTDKVDALVLAQLLRCDYLPRVWQPDAQTRQIRSITSRRTSLVGERTAIKNRLHSILHQRLIHHPGGDLFGDKGIRWLREVQIDEIGRAAIDSELRLLDNLEEELDLIDKELARRSYEDDRVKLLMTLPGVDYTIAITLLAALGDITRFRDADHAASYLGLVPSTKQSADNCYHGPITKQGASQARWVMVQAAQRLSSHPGPLGVFFRKLAHKKNHNIAVVAGARKLVVIAWHMLTKNEPYRYALPSPTAAKLSRLRVKVTGQRRRSGNAKGSKRPETYGTGQGTREIPSLKQVCTSEGLPVVETLSAGERRMLEDRKLSGFVRGINETKRVPRRTGQGRKKEEKVQAAS